MNYESKDYIEFIESIVSDLKALTNESHSDVGFLYEDIKNIVEKTEYELNNIKKEP